MTRTYTIRTYAVTHRSDRRRRLIIRAATSASATRESLRATSSGRRTAGGKTISPLAIYCEERINHSPLTTPARWLRLAGN